MIAASKNSLRERIFELVREHYLEEHAQRVFQPGLTPVPVSGRVYDDSEIVSLVDSALDFWLTEGRFVDAFEARLAEWFGLRHCSFVNSGSSANLAAFSALTSPKLKERAIRPGDEVITAAAGFPTTVNPIVQNRCVPVFIDVHIPTYGIDVAALEEALSPKTKAVFVAHTLGNPFDLDAVTAFCRDHDLWLIEDCCDALGATWRGRHVGTFGDLATLSFYPAHHITTGEGGAILTNKGQLRLLAESFRDWGRDCWCAPGQDNTCSKRFGWQLGELPCGYDHKYIYSHIGYNLKGTEMQAAIGLAQMDKLPEFIRRRNENFRYLETALDDLREWLILPEATPGAEPSWFGYPVAVRADAPFSRTDLQRRLDEAKIGTRLLFAGDLTRQPAYRDVEYRKVGDLPGTTFAMNQVFWVGVYPGLSTEMLDFTAATLRASIQDLLP